MSIFIVGEGDYVEDYAEHGVFSTKEKADGYVQMVADAEELQGIPVEERSYLEVSEREVDDLTDLFPVFVAQAWRTPGSRVKKDIWYLSEVPETRFSLANGVEAYGRTPAEALDKLKAQLIL